MHISPIHFLAVMLIGTIAARVTFVVLRQRHRRALNALARTWQMHYSAYDRFGLSDRVAERFPLPGAAEMRVADLIYGTEQSGNAEFYRYIFAAEFTTGVTRGKHRHRRVATFREPKGRATSADWSPLALAPEEQPILEQYSTLKRDSCEPMHP